MKTKNPLLCLLTLLLGLASNGAQAGLITDPLSVQAPFTDGGLTTDPLGQDGKKLVTPAPVVTRATQFLANVIADGQTVRLSDLFLNPEFFTAAHASGPEADALRGQLDWLMMCGIVVGLDDDDGLDDFRPLPPSEGFVFGTTQSFQHPAPAMSGSSQSAPSPVPALPPLLPQ